MAGRIGASPSKRLPDSALMVKVESLRSQKLPGPGAHGACTSLGWEIKNQPSSDGKGRTWSQVADNPGLGSPAPGLADTRPTPPRLPCAPQGVHTGPPAPVDLPRIGGSSRSRWWPTPFKPLTGTRSDWPGRLSGAGTPAWKGPRIRLLETARRWGGNSRQLTQAATGSSMGKQRSATLSGQTVTDNG